MNFEFDEKRLEEIDKDFKDCVENRQSQRGQEQLNKNELLFYWFSEYIIDLATYDDELSVEIGKQLYNVCKAIIENNQMKYIEDDVDDEVYKDYIISLNIINNSGYNEEVLEWGSSIRFAWFNPDSSKAILIQSAVKYIDKELVKQNILK